MSKCIEIKMYVVSYASKSNTMLSFSINDLHIENVYNFNFLGLTINSRCDLFITHLYCHRMHYALLAWGKQCHKIELLQKKALRVIFSKSPIAYTEPLLKIMSQPKLSDLYITNLLKLYYKVYRNRLPTYFECFFARI